MKILIYSLTIRKMARWKKTSSKKIAEVVNEKLKKPDSSLKDLSKKTWVNKQTVSDILKKEWQEVLTSSDYSKKLIEDNIKIIKKWKEIILKELEKLNTKKGIKIVSVSDIKSLSSTIEEALSTENKEINIKIIE